MRTFLFFMLGAGLIVLQTTIFQLFPEWVGVPDLLFLVIVYMAINFRAYNGAFLALLFGTGMEVFSGYFLGLYALAYLLVFFVVKGLSIGLAINEANHQPPIVALAYLLANGFVFMSSSMLADENLTPWVWGGVLQRVLIITVLVLPFNRFLDWVSRLANDRPASPSFFLKAKGNRYISPK